MRILTINSGSSSIKFSLYDMGDEETLLLSGNASGIGATAGRFRITDSEGHAETEEERTFPDHAAALETINAWFSAREETRRPEAAGHRIVHGGSQFIVPHRINARLIAAIENLVPFAPDHLPHEVAAIRAIERFYPGIAQVACFDTAFHRTMPDVAQRYALSEDVLRHGIVRYGFHGLSYEYILAELRKEAGSAAAQGRVIVAHLGNGASMGAFKDGKSRDTTMGFTPAGGLVMSTRSGDLDPGVIVYLLKEKGMSAAALNRLVTKEAGLLGVSGISHDMKELLDQEAANPHAAAAVELFCYQAKKFLGALAAVLGGIDTLVFTGGIGENAARVRARICEGLDFLGILIDTGLNVRHAPIISRSDGPAVVRVMKTNEELMIARHTYDLIRNKGGSHEREKQKRPAG